MLSVSFRQLSDHYYGPPCAHSRHCFISLLHFKKVNSLRQCSKGKGYGDMEQNSFEGDPEVQDSLVDMIQFQIGKKQVEEFVELESEKLRQNADEAKREIDRVAREQQERSAESLDKAMEEINNTANEFAKELKKKKEENEADAKNFSAWERQMAVKRSQGLFFKNLYETEEDSLVAEDGSMLKEEAMEQAQETARKTQSGLGSKARMGAFAALSAVLLVSIISDVSSGSPRWVLDAVYALCAIFFTSIAVAELLLSAESQRSE